MAASDSGSEHLDIDGPPDHEDSVDRGAVGTPNPKPKDVNEAAGELTRSQKRRLKRRAAKAANPAFTTPAWVGAAALTPVQRQQARVQSKFGINDRDTTADSPDPANAAHADSDQGNDDSAAAAKPKRKAHVGPMTRQLLGIRDAGKTRLKLGKIVAQKELDRRDAQLSDLQAQLSAAQQQNVADRDLAARLATLEQLFSEGRVSGSTTSASAPTDPVPRDNRPADAAAAVNPAPGAAGTRLPATVARNPAPGTYLNAAARGVSLAEAQAKLAESEANVAELTMTVEELRSSKAEAEARLAAVEGKTFLQALAKPSTFTGVKVNGKPTLSVRDWVLSVQDYTESLHLSSDRLRVAVAESYLGGAAKRDWHTKRKVMLDSDTAVTWDSFMHAVVDSWDPACSDVKARMQLEKLRFKGNMTAYVSQFDRLCSFIPKMNADERVHKFLYQIQATHPHVAQDLQTDPAGKERWTDYHALRKYALHTAATAAPTRGTPGLTDAGMFVFKSGNSLPQHADPEGRLNVNGLQFNRNIFAQLEAKCGKPFTLDACCDPDGNNRLVDSWCSPAQPFTQAQCEGYHVWLAPPVLRLHSHIAHYLRCKQKRPAATSACILVPRWPRGKHTTLLKGMRLLQEYPAGTTLYSAADGRQWRAPWAFQVWYDAPATLHAGYVITDSNELVMEGTAGSPLRFDAQIAGAAARLKLDSGASHNFLPHTQLEQCCHALHQARQMPRQ